MVSQLRISHGLPGCEIQQGQTALLCNLQFVLSCDAKLGALCDKTNTTARETIK